MATRATGREVALAANVSQSTVSLVLSGRAEGRVSVRTQQLVRRVAEELGYLPHAAPRLLRLGRSGLVMLVVPDLRNPFFLRVLDGVQQAARDHEVSMVLVAEQCGAVPRDSVNAVDGLLVCSGAYRDAAAHLGHVPTVVLNATPPPGVPCVRPGVAAGMTAVRSDHPLATDRGRACRHPPDAAEFAGGARLHRTARRLDHDTACGRGREPWGVWTRVRLRWRRGPRAPSRPIGPWPPRRPSTRAGSRGPRRCGSPGRSAGSACGAA